jgi:DNA-binding TFAR19-related protein (PDSD5 family)
MSKEAYQRYANIRAANPDLAVQVLVTVTQYLEKLKLRTIGDGEFKEILQKIMPQKREFNIKRK